MPTERAKIKRAKLLAMLKAIAIAKEVNHPEIGLHCGIKPNNVSRLLMGRYSPELDTFIDLADAVGYEVTLTEKREKG
jgi:hypothetical protein